MGRPRRGGMPCRRLFGRTTSCRSWAGERW
jgi:hypothetical protein